MSFDRQSWMGLLARAPQERLLALWQNLGLASEFTWLRPPEIGGVMVRGRAGGTGSPFNLGEMTVTRCTLRLNECGTVGHAYVQGRDKAKAEVAALVDALMQTDVAADVSAQIMSPLSIEEKERRALRAEKAAATKVDFFTMTRGENT